MASFNKVIVMGNAGKDPEVRYLPSGIAVASVSVATSRKRKDKNTGEAIEETQWHRVVFFDRLAEIVGEYVKKGKSILVEGSLKYGKYEKDGVTHYTTDIVAESMQLLGGREDGQQGQGGGQSAPQRQQPQQQPQRQQPNAYQDARGGGAPRQQPQRQQPPQGSSGFDDMDDDIPF